MLCSSTGASRMFGFIGFRNDADALKALNFFDKTYIQTSKISVTIAKPVGLRCAIYVHLVSPPECERDIQKGDSTIDRPWSKYSKGSSRHPDAVSDVKSGDASEGDSKGPTPRHVQEAQDAKLQVRDRSSLPLICFSYVVFGSCF